ncbi:MAG: ribokinase [Eubacteriales bacterium]|nr:ribokinase [Eubacteriales bacterium]
MKKICVVGSINIDMVAMVPRFPGPGESLSASSFMICHGGKGANQAVGAARLGACVTLVGKIGDDHYGAAYMEALQKNKVKCGCIGVEKGTMSGLALIEVDSSGENRIVSVKGANKKVSIEFIELDWDKIAENDIFMIQLEIPAETVLYLIRKLKCAGKTVILDPAPAVVLPDELFGLIDYITPNETEIGIISGNMANKPENLSAADILLEKGSQCVILKAGKNGAFIITGEDKKHVPGFKVTPVDTTGAGDSFNAAFAVGLAEGMNVEESVRFANAAAALSVTAAGAQTAMPSRDAVDRFIKEAGT